MRIKYHWQALDQEMIEINYAKARGESYKPVVFSNGDTVKQLLTRSRYLVSIPNTPYVNAKKA